MTPLPVIAIVGATATGKSALAVDSALWLVERGQPAEIVNADSMLVYRGMDIGTAKPTLAERRGVAHHLIDILDVTQRASVAEFQGWARAAIADCRERGVVPIVVGGSALYVHAVLDRFEFPATDPAVRAGLEAELAALGCGALHARLAALDPAAAAGIEQGNGRRIVRALEAIALTGSFRSTLPAWEYAIDDVVQIGLAIDQAEMDARIARRVRAMWDQGLVAEVEGLLARGLRESVTASRAIGYAQAIAHLDGFLTADEAQERIVVKTRQFARKQLSWWRRDDRIVWLDALDSTPPTVLAAAGFPEPN